MNALLPGPGPAPIVSPPAARGAASHSIVSARRRGRMHCHPITPTTDREAARRGRAHSADRLTRVMPTAGGRLSVHHGEEVA